MRWRSSAPKYSISTPPARAVALDPHPGLEPLAQRVDHALEVGVEAGARARRAPRARGRGPRELLGGAHRELLAHDAVAQLPAALGVRDLEQGLGVARREALLLDVLLELARQLEQAQVVRDGRAVEARRAGRSRPGSRRVSSSARKASASSIGFRSRRCTFSTSATSSRSRSSMSATTAGIAARPAARAARQRRSPTSELVAIAGAPHHDGLEHAVLPDRVGERARARPRRSARRGCSGFGSMRSTGISPGAGSRRGGSGAAEAGGGAGHQRADAAAERIRTSAHRDLLGWRGSGGGSRRGASGGVGARISSASWRWRSRPSSARRRAAPACRGSAPRTAARCAGSPSRRPARRSGRAPRPRPGGSGCSARRPS